MQKSTPEERLERLLRAATRVFARKGFRRTQMADVAAELEVSVGSLYNYVESKDALFHACLVRASPAATAPKRPPTLPLATPTPATTRRAVRTGLDAVRADSALARALATDAPDDIVSELAEVIGDIYDRTAASHRFQTLVERSADDLPDLFDAFFLGMRRPALDALAEYLRRRIDSGHLRAVADVPTTARLVNETQSWFARHRRGDPHTTDVSDEHARATVIDVLVNGLLPR